MDTPMEEPRPFRVVWTLGNSGAGKTMAANRARPNMPPMACVVVKAKENNPCFPLGGKWNLPYRLGDRVAELGVFDPKRTKDNTLSWGTDQYTCIERPLLKHLLAYLKNEGVRIVFLEGVGVINKPLLDAINALGILHIIHITTPREVCWPRFVQRQTIQLELKHIKYRLPRDKWEKVCDKVDMVLSAADTVVQCIDDEAPALIVEALHDM